MTDHRTPRDVIGPMARAQDKRAVRVDKPTLFYVQVHGRTIAVYLSPDKDHLSGCVVVDAIDVVAKATEDRQELRPCRYCSTSHTGVQCVGNPEHMSTIDALLDRDP